MTPKLLEFVQNRLEKERGAWPEIATQAGVPYSTLAKIVQGQTKNPGILTIESLAAVLTARIPETERRTELDEVSR